MKFLKQLAIFLGFSTFAFSQSLNIPPYWSANAIIYEVNIRQFTEEGTFSAFSEHLPRLKELGVDILWLMPINPIGKINRKGTLGSYYSVQNYTEVNPEFGTKEEFKNLVHRAHEIGFYVIIDWVANHTAWDNPWVKEHPDFFEKDKNGNFTPPHGTDWTDVIQLDYKNKELWKEMTNSMKFWIDEMNIDGFRCDVAFMLPTEFWNQARAELEKTKPIFMLAEAWQPELHNFAFNMTYNWELKDILNSFAKGEKNVTDIVKHFEKEKKIYKPKDFRMNFTSNHDLNSWDGTEFERYGNKAEIFAVLTYIVPGMPLIYNGQEMGLNRRLNFFEKDPIKWETNKYFNFYKRLNSLKKSNPALFAANFGGSFEILFSNEKNNTLGIFRQKGNNKVVAVFNFSDKEAIVKINHESLKDIFTELNSETKIQFSESNKFTLKPLEYKIFYK